MRLGKQSARATGGLEEIVRYVDGGNPAVGGNPDFFYPRGGGCPHVASLSPMTTISSGRNPKSRMAFYDHPGAGLRQSQPSSGPCGQK